MSTMMTQELLVGLLEGRGWKVEASRDEWNATQERIYPDVEKGSMLDMRKGISLHALAPTGYVLSLQAGVGNYSEPRAYADMYESLEFAIWLDRDGSRDGPFIRDHRLSDGDDVVGWADFDKIVMAIEIIESWSGDNAPMRGPRRKNAPWDVDD